MNKTWPKVLLALGALLLVLAALWPLLRPDHPSPSAVSDQQLMPTPAASSTPAAPSTAAPSGGANPTAIPTDLGGAGIAGYSSWDGLKGGSTSQSIPRHHIVLSLTSRHKLPFVIYNIPTSRDHRGGQSTDLGNTWSLATTVYGKPDYAQLFTRAGPEGYPITCTITVDGRVTAHLTSDGPWGKIFCQG